MTTAAKKLSFAYLYYTRSNMMDTTLIGVFKSLKDAKSHLDPVNGEYVGSGNRKRVLQKSNELTGQIWYVEKQVFMDAR